MTAATSLPSARLRGALLIAAATVCWSSGGILVRLMERAEPWQMVFWRSLFMGLSLVVILATIHRRRVLREYRAVGRAGLLSAFLLSFAFAFYILSLSHTTVANTQVIASTSPLFAALFAWIALREPVLPRTWLAMTATLGGIALMFAESLGTSDGSLLGNLFALGIGFFFAANIVVLRHSRAVNMVPAVSLAGFLSAAMALPLAWPLFPGWHDLALLLLLGFFQLSLGLMFFTIGARHLPAAEVGLLGLLETILAPIWVWIGVGERPSSLALIGGGIVLAALALHSLLGTRRTAPPVGHA